MNTCRFLFFLLTNLVWITANAQAPDWGWAVNSGQSNTFQNRNSNCLVTDSSGYVYSLGQGLSKYTSSGSLLWSKNIPAHSIANDAAGNLYVTGIFSGTIQVDTISLVCPLQHEVAMFTAKLNSNGKALWARIDNPSPKFGGDDGPYISINNISADSAGNSLVSGFRWVDARFDSITLTNTNNYPKFCFVAMFDKNGKVKMAHAHKTAIREAILGPQNTYYIRDYYSVKKFSISNTLLWEKEVYLPPNNNARAYVSQLAVDKQGNCFVLGNMADTLVLDKYILKPSGKSNLFLVKYAPNGQMLWARTIQNLSDTTYTIGQSLFVNNKGQIFIGGSFSGAISFDSRMPALSSASGQGFVAKLSASTGMPHWARLTSETGFVYPAAIAGGLNDELYVAGTFSGQNLSFGNSTISETHGFSYNFFLGKLLASPAGPLEKPQESEPLITSQLYPNPANAEVNLNMPAFGNGNLQVYNTAGKQIHITQLPANGKLKVRTGNWAGGLYFLRISGDGNAVTHKLVVQH